MTEFDPVEFGREMGALIREAVEPLKAEIAELRSRQPEKGEKGDPGQDAPPVELDVSEVVKELLAADGVKQIVGLEVEAYMAENPPAAGKDGDKGDPGEPGKSVTLDDVSLFLDAAVAKHVLDFERRANETLAKAIDKIPEPKDGRDGKDGRSVEGLTRRYVPESHEIVETWSGPDGQHELRYPAGGIHHKGYWSEKVKAKAGESWTHNGTLWIANEDTADEPSTASKAWTIGARKGRDGKDGRNGIDKTAPVKVKGDA